mmetsp:Transcript_15119/g.23428  ORF Transcript_15119/g.23428 Transcript_15119/m.23428 type:complete len:197 (+) Transcript_15119:55-645(+)
MNFRVVYSIIFITTQQRHTLAFSSCLHRSRCTLSPFGTHSVSSQYPSSKPFRSSTTLTMSTGQPSAAACVPGGKCLPCESLDKSHLLSPQQVATELSSMKLWKLSDDSTKITRSYTARNFQSAMDSLNEIGKIAERENHHPDMHLTGYRNVEIVLFTHSLGGISLNDIAMAKMIDEEVSFNYSPKWLRENPAAKKD